METDEFFTVNLGGANYIGWTSFSIGRTMEQGSGEFDLALTRRKNEEDLYVDGSVAAGMPIQIALGGEVYLDGFIGALGYSYDARSSSIRATGGDKIMDLVQCAAAVDGKFEFTNLTLDAAVAKVLQPYNIQLTVEADMGAAFQRLAIQPGEKAFEFIERLCRQRSVLPLSDGIGGLILTKPGNAKSDGRLVYGDNILRGDVSIDEAEMFSVYVVKGQAEPVYANEEDVAGSVQASGRMTDTLITRYRPTVLIGENQGYDMSLKERALWERKMARARSRRASYTVAGWHTDQASANLWRLNTLVPVQDERAGLHREMLIAGLRFNYAIGTGKTTQIELVMPEAFDISAEVQDKEGASTVWVADEGEV